MKSRTFDVVLFDFDGEIAPARRIAQYVLPGRSHVEVLNKKDRTIVAWARAIKAAEPEVVIGELDGPVGTAFATLMGDQAKGHSKVLAIMNTDVMVRPPTFKTVVVVRLVSSPH